MKAHITNLGLENFRVFKDKVHFDFAPITILTGTNNSGKSSLIRAMELLSYNFKGMSFSKHPAGDNEFFRLFSKYSSFDKHPIEAIVGIHQLNKAISIGPFADNFGSLKSVLTKGNASNEFVFTTKAQGYKTVEFFVCKYTYYLDDKIFPELHLAKVEVFNKNDDVIFEYGNTIKINFTYFFKLFKKTFEVSKKCWSDLLEKIDLLNSNDKLDEDTKSNLEKSLYKSPLNLNGNLDLIIAKEEGRFYLKNIKGRNDDKWDSPLYDSFGILVEILAKNELQEFHDLNLINKTCDEFPVLSTFMNYILKGNSREKFTHNYFEMLSMIEFEPSYYLLQSYSSSDKRDEVKSSYPFDDDRCNTFTFSKSILADLPTICGIEIQRKSKSDVGADSNIVKFEFPITALEKWFYQDFLANSLSIITHAIKPFNLIETQRITTSTPKILRFWGEKDWLSEFVKNYLIANNELSKEILTFINKWLVKFNLGEELVIETIEDTEAFKIFIKDASGQKFHLTEVGYGITMILRVIIHSFNELPKDESWDILYGGLPIPKIRLIEEPESNLHPALQSKLADLFIDAAKTFGIQFIIETHSEYLIRKLQYLTAKGEIKPEDTAIYYFYPPDGGPPGEDQVKRIDILKDGRLSSPFGEGFYDESARLMIELMNIHVN